MRIVNCIAITALSTTAHANLIVNGGFDTFVPLNGTGGGWNASGNDNLGGWSASGGNPGAFYALNAGGNFTPDPVLSQTIDGLMIGCLYQLTGFYASNILNNSPGNATDSLVITANSGVIFEAGPTPLGDWRPFTTTFVADASSVTITIAAEANGSDNDFRLDSFSLNLVPSPSSTGVLGLAGLVAARRRRAL